MIFKKKPSINDYMCATCANRENGKCRKMRCIVKDNDFCSKHKEAK